MNDIEMSQESHSDSKLTTVTNKQTLLFSDSAFGSGTMEKGGLTPIYYKADSNQSGGTLGRLQRSSTGNLSPSTEQAILEISKSSRFVILNFYY